MKLSIRLWLARLLVAMIAIGGGLNGYLAYATHGDHHSVAHILGLESGKHDHENAQAYGSGTYLPFCQVEATCNEEPGNTTSHVHVSCFGPLAVTTGEVPVAELSASAVINLDLEPQFLLGQVFYPPFKPPRASA